MRHFISGNLIGWDTEGTGLYPYLGDRPFAFSFANAKGETSYFEFDVDPFTRQPIYDNRRLDQIAALLEDPAIAKSAHNHKYDRRMVEIGCDIHEAGEMHETELMAKVANPGEFGYQLKPLCKRYGGIDDEDEKHLERMTKACRTWARGRIKKLKEPWALADDWQADYWLCRAVGKRSPEMLARFPDLMTVCEKYARLDAIRVIFADQFYRRNLEEDGLWAVYLRELELWPVVYEMEGRGVRIDIDLAQRERKFCMERCKELRKQLEVVFGTFNEDVPPNRLRRYLFTDSAGCLNLPYDANKLTKVTKEPQVTRDVLEKLVDQAPILGVLVDYDKHGKAADSFFANYIHHAVKEAVYHVLHANFTQIGAKTTRFSCRDPALQQCPKRAKKGEIMRRVRGPFGPRDGYLWLHLDYKTIEARIFAEEANEREMLAVFARGDDIYQDLVDRVTEITGFDLDTLLEAQGGARQVCKNNFLGWTYGEGLFKMSQMLKIPGDAAEMVIMALQRAYPDAMPFMDNMQAIAKEQGCIINRYGYRIPVPRPVMKDGKWYRFYYRAVNYLIQSTAAAMMKSAMLRCAAHLKAHPELDAHIVMTIHDELVFEVLRGHLTRRLVRTLQRIMEDNGDVFRHVTTPTDASVTESHWDEPRKLSFPTRKLVAA